MDMTTGAVIIAGLKYTGPQAAKVVGDFVDRIFGPSAKSVGEELDVSVAEWRKRRAARGARLLHEAAMRLKESDIEPVAVPPRVLLPLLERGSLEEEDDMRMRWSSLLATAASAEEGIPPGFISILADLSPTEARLLDECYRLHKDQPLDMFPWSVGEELTIGLQERNVAIDNIARLGLWRKTGASIPGTDVLEVVRKNHYDVNKEIFVNDDGDLYVFTALGRAFVEACQHQPQD